MPCCKLDLSRPSAVDFISTLCLARHLHRPTDRQYMFDHRRPTILFYAIGIQRTEEEEEEAAEEEEEEDGAGGFGL